MNSSTSQSLSPVAEELLTRYRQLNEKGWRQILSMTDVLDKRVVELSLAGEDGGGFDPYDSSTRLPRLTV